MRRWTTRAPNGESEPGCGCVACTYDEVDVCEASGARSRRGGDGGRRTQPLENGFREAARRRRGVRGALYRRAKTRGSVLRCTHPMSVSHARSDTDRRTLRQRFLRTQALCKQYLLAHPPPTPSPRIEKFIDIWVSNGALYRRAKTRGSVLRCTHPMSVSHARSDTDRRTLRQRFLRTQTL